MNAWSNIEIPADDPEIVEIDRWAESIANEISPDALQVRELITRFEVCHFKLERHIEYIHESISNLKPSVDPNRIGEHHIRNGPDAYQHDRTGRLRPG